MQWGRTTFTLPIEPEIEVRVTMPRHLSPEQWARMLHILDEMRPGIVKLPAGNGSEAVQKLHEQAPARGAFTRGTCQAGARSAGASGADRCA